MPKHEMFPIGTRVVLIESGAAGCVVSHVRASMDDRPAKKAHRVKWDSFGTVSYVRPGRLRRELAPVAERIQAALGEVLSREIGLSGFGAYESGTGVFFDFKGAPCGAKSFVVFFDDETELCRVLLLRKDLSTAQGKRAVPLSRLGAAVRRLSEHGG